LTKNYFLAILFLIDVMPLSAQKQYKNKQLSPVQRGFTFNPLALAEPQAAASLGFYNKQTPHSGYFTELSYVFKAPFYGGADPVTGGFRWLLQYRYYPEKKGKSSFFWGVEFRLKGYGFTGKNTFVNKAVADTIRKYNYKANAASVGGAILLGTSFNLSKNNQWQLEVTAGIGAKQKFIKYKNLPNGYELYEPPDKSYPDILRPPEIDEAVGMPYFPIAFRICYQIR
jgi:hypothetical protein